MLFSEHERILARARHLSRADMAPPAMLEESLRYGASVGRTIERHRRLGRCMGRLRQLIGEHEERGTSLASGTVVLAGELDQASGRFDRVWHAPPGGLWMAMAWSDVLLPAFAGLLPLAAGIACCEAVRLQGVGARLKWVNDVHVDGRKLAGLLCQTVTSPGGERFHLLGIGINANNSCFPPELRSIAVSIAELTGNRVDLEQLLLDLLARLVSNLGALHAEEACYLETVEGAAEATADCGTLRRWQDLSDTLGREVLYGRDIQQAPLYQATAIGLDPSGGLRLRLADGSLITEYSGELRYLYPAD